MVAQRSAAIASRQIAAARLKERVAERFELCRHVRFAPRAQQDDVVRQGREHKRGHVDNVGPRLLGETTHSPYGEAGRLLGVREATINTRLYRARQRIADSLTGMDRLAAASRRPMK
jgi:hypothetical protein